MRVNVIKKGYEMLNATKGRAKNVVNFFSQNNLVNARKVTGLRIGLKSGFPTRIT